MRSREARRWGAFAGAASIVLTIFACTERVAVGPEGQFSWEPQTQLVWPVQGAIVSAYGDAARPGHRGIDLAAKPGDPVGAARLGRVAFVGDIAGYGRTVVLSHDDRVSTVYAHLGATRVAEGDAVSRGQTIGTISSEGYLHYEIREAAQPVDPAKYYAVAPEPAQGVSTQVQSKVASEPGSVGTLGMLGVEPVPEPTAAGAVVKLPRPTAVPEAASTPRPRATVRPAPTLVPTVAPTPFPTAVPTRVPTLVPTPRPTATPRPAPTPLPTRRDVAPLRAQPPRQPTTPLPTPTPAPIAPPAPAEPAAEESSTDDTWSQIGMGAGLVGANLLYVPAKLVYSAVGAVTGAIALVVAHDSDVANMVWVPTMRGDYVVTAEHLRGERPLQFQGTAP